MRWVSLLLENGYKAARLEGCNHLETLTSSLS